MAYLKLCDVTKSFGSGLAKVDVLNDVSMEVEKGEMCTVLGLSELKNRFPQELSGGQQQRCSIGRALIKNPKLLLCDEPTGTLDYKTSKDILELLENINKTYNTTIFIVTHNETICEMTHKTVFLKDGAVSCMAENHNIKPARELEWQHDFKQGHLAGF